MSEFTLSCPVPLRRYERVVMAHGGGGRLTRELIEQLFAAAFAGESECDAAVRPWHGARIAMTTDSFVVHPLEFPGGDIGSLAVHGTVNDLAMSGARPRYLSAGFILEEGLEMELLWRVVQSMAKAARAAGVSIVTGDTKVVERGKGDGLYINTAGVGELLHQQELGPKSIRAGDAIIVSGDLGRHGMAILAAREGLKFTAAIESDSAAVHEPVLALLEEGLDVHALRDLTRGGLATVLCEMAAASGHTLRIEDERIEVTEPVRALCEVLGFEPLYVANEGRFVAFVPEAEAARAVEILRGYEVSAGARAVGKVLEGRGMAVAASVFGGTRILDLLSGEQLPRIC